MDKLHTLDVLIDGFAEHGDKPALLSLQPQGIQRWSYRELAQRIGQLAYGLVEVGVGQGDRVALLADNRPEWIVACLAVIKAGGIAVPLDVQLSDKVLGRILNDSGTRFIFSTLDEADRLQQLDIEAELRPLLFDAEADDERSWHHLLTEEARDLPSIQPDDPAALFYTSGTTGPPKGVPLSHGNLAFQLNTLREARLVTENDRVLLPLPLHHVYPLVIGMLAPLSLGLPLILPQSMTGPQIIRALKEGQVTLVIGVPRLYNALYSGIRARLESAGWLAATLFKPAIGLSAWLRHHLGLRVGKWLLRPLHKQFGPRLRVLASGGSALKPELAWKLEGLGWQVAIGYGLTETSPLITINPPGKAKLESVGQPTPGIEVRIDTSAHPGDSSQKQKTEPSPQQGEILVRGPNVFAGYHHLPDKTKEVFTADGWFRTGDLGYLDEQGYLYVLGRVSTLIVTEGGKNIQPEDVEEAYQAHPVISEIGVLQKNDQLVAVIIPEVSEVRQRGGDIEEAVREAVQEQSRQLPSYQRISDYVISREPLERTRLGKIRRHLLDKRYGQIKAGEREPDEAAAGPMPIEQMSREDRDLLENPAAKQVWEWLAERYPQQRLTPDTSPQLDLGIDSLAWLNLTMEISQRTGVELSEEAIGRIDTVRDLLREVAEQAESGETVTRAPPLEEPEQALSKDQKRWLQPLGPVRSAMASGLYGLNWILMRGCFRLQVKGLEHLPAGEQFILAPNHASLLDPFVIAAALDWRLLRRTYWSGWTGWAFRNPLTRAVSRLAQAVPIDPDRAIVSSLAFSAAVLKRQKNLIWFPEGQRSPTGELQRFRPGIGILLDHFQVPVIPVYIQGTHEAMPVGKALPRLRRISVVFGRPLDPEDLQQEGEGDNPQDRIVSALRNQVAELGKQS